MKTKNMILTAGLLGLAYLVYKNSNAQPTEQSTDDTSGGGGGGGAFPLSYHPVLPAISNPIIAPIEVVVPIIEKRRNNIIISCTLQFQF